LIANQNLSMQVAQIITAKAATPRYSKNSTKDLC